MSDMIERCITAVVDKIGVPDEALARAIVRAVIAEMREPSGSMIDAGALTFGVPMNCNLRIDLDGMGAIERRIIEAIDGQPSICWRAMIDAASE